VSDKTYNVLFLCTGNTARSFRYMKARIALFAALPLSSIDEMALGTKLRDIGTSEGSTSTKPRVA
jgi:arsenate reductase (thioredoxin)